MDESEGRMIISAKLIKHHRAVRYCEGYKCNGDKAMFGEQIELFGASDGYDKPFTLYICTDCAKGSTDVQKALNRHNIKRSKP